MYNKETHLSEHFSKKEITYSPTAEKYKIDNTPSKEQWKRIQTLVDKILEPVRVGLDKPLIVNSIFRSQKLNERVKGSGTSQHLANNGAAADIECPDGRNQLKYEKQDKKGQNKQIGSLILFQCLKHALPPPSITPGGLL